MATRSGRRAVWLRYRWPLLAALTVLGLAFGYIGLERYGTAQHQSHPFLDVVYSDLALFRFSSSAKPPLPWQLEIARFLLPALLLYGAVSGLLALFRDRFQQARLPLLRGHVIVAGVGVKGLAFVKALRTDRRTVVVIEDDATSTNLASAREAGAIVIIGDARDRDVLDVAGVRKARYLLVTADDATNAEVASQAQRLKQGPRGTNLECIAHIIDPELCILLKRQTLLRPTTASGFRIDFFNFYDHAARRVCESTLRADDRVITIGSGPLTDQLIVHAVSQHAQTRPDPLDVTVTGGDANARIAALTAHYPHLAQAAQLHPIEVQPDVAFLCAAEVLRADRGPATVYLSDADEGTLLELALGLRDLARATKSRIVVCTNQANGLASMLSATGSGSELEPILVVALARETCTSDLVDRGVYELLGRAIHDAYVRSRLAEGSLPEGDPALAPWGELPESLRDSNRAQAEHIGVKLHAVGCDLVPSDGSTLGVFEFTNPEIELLGRMEHDRWMDERRRAGWRKGAKRDPYARTSPYLVDWEQLPDDIRERDRETVRGLPDLVGRAGFRIVRLTSPGETESATRL